jgi:hypothetical protein
VADGVREIHQPILEGPPWEIGVKQEAEGEVGRPVGFERGYDLVRKLLQGIGGDLDPLAGLLLESGDDLPDRLVLLRIVALLPPHHEVGGVRAKRRQHERGGENRSSAAHVVTSPMGRIASISSLPIRGNVRATSIGKQQASGLSAKVGFGSWLCENGKVKQRLESSSSIGAISRRKCSVFRWPALLQRNSF